MLMCMKKFNCIGDIMVEKRVMVQVNTSEKRYLNELIEKIVEVQFLSDDGTIDLNTFITSCKYLQEEHKDATKIICFAHGGIIFNEFDEDFNIGIKN